MNRHRQNYQAIRESDSRPDGRHVHIAVRPPGSMGMHAPEQNTRHGKFQRPPGYGRLDQWENGWRAILQQQR
jgi:hypothetical protein